MAFIPYSFPPQAGYTGDYTIRAYTVANPTVVVGTDVKHPVFTNPVTGVVTVPTYEPHIVRIFACDPKRKVGEFEVDPRARFCAKPGTPVISAITGTTATATWAASPVPPGQGYEWHLLILESGNYSQISTGTTPLLTVNLTGMVAGHSYRFYVVSHCYGNFEVIHIGDYSSSVYTDFNSAAAAPGTGIITVNHNRTTGAYVVIRSTTNLNRYTCDSIHFTSNTIVPFDQYEIWSYDFHVPCTDTPGIAPALHALFTIDLATPTFTINIGCI